MTDPWAGAAAAPTIPWHCGICEKASVLVQVDRWWISPEGDEEFDPFERVLLKCTGCRMPYVLGRDADFHGEESPLEQLYPQLDQPLPRHIPQTIRDSHDEAIRCRAARCHTAAALMTRRGAEAICAEHGERKGTLGPKLKKLALHS